MYEILIANSEAEKKRIYKFRYEIYIKELQKHYIDYYPKAEELKDYKDDFATNAYIESNSKMVGSLRFYYGTYNESLKTEFGINKIDDEIIYGNIERFMIEPESRGTFISAVVIKWIYEYGLRNNVKIALIQVETKLVDLFKRYGFIPYREIFVSENKQQKRFQMYLNLYDLTYFENIKSPFTKLLKKHLNYVKSNLNNSDQTKEHLVH